MLQRVRGIIEQALRINEEVQSGIDRGVEPRSDVRASITGERSLVWFHAVFALFSAAFGALVIAWVAGLLFDLSPLVRERVFWGVLSVSAAFSAAAYMQGTVAGLAVDWARKKETASRYLRSLRHLLDYLSSQLEGSVPELERFDDHDLWGPSPGVDEH